MVERLQHEQQWCLQKGVTAIKAPVSWVPSDLTFLSPFLLQWEWVKAVPNLYRTFEPRTLAVTCSHANAAFVAEFCIQATWGYCLQLAIKPFVLLSCHCSRSFFHRVNITVTKSLEVLENTHSDRMEWWWERCGNEAIFHSLLAVGWTIFACGMLSRQSSMDCRGFLESLPMSIITHHFSFCL